MSLKTIKIPDLNLDILVEEIKKNTIIFYFINFNIRGTKGIKSELNRN